MQCRSFAISERKVVSMIDVTCLGEALIDMFSVEVGRPLTEVSAFYPMPGGAPANLAVAVARQGASSRNRATAKAGAVVKYFCLLIM